MHAKRLSSVSFYKVSVETSTHCDPKTQSHKFLIEKIVTTVLQFNSWHLLRSKCASLHPTNHSLGSYHAGHFTSCMPSFQSLQGPPTIYLSTHQFICPPSTSSPSIHCPSIVLPSVHPSSVYSSIHPPFIYPPFIIYLPAPSSAIQKPPCFL